MATTPRERELARLRKQRQRARDALQAQGKAIPATIRKRNQGTPFRVRKFEGADLVSKASADALARDMRRVEALRALPNVNNPLGTLYVPNEPRRGPARLNRKGALAQAAAIREHSKTLDIKNVGRARREKLLNELDNSDQSSQYKRYMSPEQQDRFQKLSAQIAKIPLQALGIFFDYAGGANSYNAAIGRLTGSPDSVDVEEALTNLAGLAQVAEKAGRIYSPKAIGSFKL